MTRLFLILHVASYLLVASSCVNVKPVYYDDDKALARKKVEQIHQLYNGDDFASIYDLFTDRLKNEATREQFVAILTKLKQDSGQFVEAKETDSQVVPLASYREVRLKYTSKYEKGWCNEGFALFVDGKVAVVDLLMINPADGPVQPNK